MGMPESSSLWQRTVELPEVPLTESSVGPAASGKDNLSPRFFKPFPKCAGLKFNVAFIVLTALLVGSMVFLAFCGFLRRAKPKFNLFGKRGGRRLAESQSSSESSSDNELPPHCQEVGHLASLSQTARRKRPLEEDGVEEAPSRRPARVSLSRSVSQQSGTPDPRSHPSASQQSESGDLHANSRIYLMTGTPTAPLIPVFTPVFGSYWYPYFFNSPLNVQLPHAFRAPEAAALYPPPQQPFQDLQYSLLLQQQLYHHQQQQHASFTYLQYQLHLQQQLYHQQQQQHARSIQDLQYQLHRQHQFRLQQQQHTSSIQYLQYQLNLRQLYHQQQQHASSIQERLDLSQIAHAPETSSSPSAPPLASTSTVALRSSPPAPPLAAESSDLSDKWPAEALSLDFYTNHPFYRPPVVVEMLGPMEQQLFWMTGWMRPSCQLLVKLQKTFSLLSRGQLDVRASRKLLTETAMLLKSAILELDRGTEGMSTSEALGVLGKRFLVADCVLAVYHLFESKLHIDVSWGQLLPPQAPYSSEGYLTEGESNDEMRLILDLEEALDVYKRQERPSPEVVVQLKRELLDSPLTPADLASQRLAFLRKQAREYSASYFSNGGAGDRAGT